MNSNRPQLPRRFANFFDRLDAAGNSNLNDPRVCSTEFPEPPVGNLPLPLQTCFPSLYRNANLLPLFLYRAIFASPIIRTGKSYRGSCRRNMFVDRFHSQGTPSTCACTRLWKNAFCVIRRFISHDIYLFYQWDKTINLFFFLFSTN